MTTICAYRDDKETWLGSDDRATLYRTIPRSAGNKWTIGWNFAIGIVGDMADITALRRDVGVGFEKAATEEEAGGIVRAALLACVKHVPHADGPGAENAAMAFIVDVDGTGGCIRMRRGFWARGSGMELALGAAHALRGHTGAEIVRGALEAAAANDIGTARPFHICKFNPRAARQKVEKPQE